jgi:hypothetical protein
MSPDKSAGFQLVYVHSREGRSTATEMARPRERSQGAHWPRGQPNIAAARASARPLPLPLPPPPPPPAAAAASDPPHVVEPRRPHHRRCVARAAARPVRVRKVDPRCTQAAAVHGRELGKHAREAAVRGERVAEGLPAEIGVQPGLGPRWRGGAPGRGERVMAVGGDGAGGWNGWERVGAWTTPLPPRPNLDGPGDVHISETGGG